MSQKKRKRMASPEQQSVMRITKARREHIERVAEAVGAIAPSTSPGQGFCVQKVARDMGLKDCWRKQQNKKADIAHLLQGVMRRHPRKPKALVLEIVRGGVQWKARKGQQVTTNHLDAIAEPMEALGSRIRDELREIEIPDPSRVRRPSQNVVTLFDRLDLHEALKVDVAEMFRDGHFNEAVRKGLERFEKCMQDALDDRKTFGRDLMAKAFGSNPPPISLNALKTANDQSEQEGFKLLSRGAMSGMRNLYSHGDVAQMTAMDALERLAFVSLLFKRVQSAIAHLSRGV